jgi:hypothetical protein
VELTLLAVRHLPHPGPPHARVELTLGNKTPRPDIRAGREILASYSLVYQTNFTSLCKTFPREIVKSYSSPAMQS